MSPSLRLVCLLSFACFACEDPPPEGMSASNDPEGSVASMVLTASSADEPGASARRWDVLGRPLDGKSALVPLPGNNQFWFAWSVFNHGSQVFGRAERVSTNEIQSGGNCGVPCDHIVQACEGIDCIPALSDPAHVERGNSEAAYVQAHSFVVGVLGDAEARAYPHNVLWWHEVVNDTIGEQAIALTHSVLSFSTVAYDALGFTEGERADITVSGLVYNANHIFYHRQADTAYSQLLDRSILGETKGLVAPRVPVFEMTWAAWAKLNPGSTVLSSNTGHGRDYSAYPYEGYFSDSSNTFGILRPAADPMYVKKDVTYGLRVGEDAKGYVHWELGKWARAHYGADSPPRGVYNDVVGGRRIAIVFDNEASYVQAFDAEGYGDFELEN